jgi:hypothetical protein
MRIVAVLSVALLVPAQAPAQDVGEGDAVFKHVQNLAGRGLGLQTSLGSRHKLLSSGGHRLVELGSGWDELEGIFKRARDLRNRVAARGSEPVSDPFAAEDFLSRLAGNTQSETTLGWCGDTAVSGFNDSGSFVATFLGVGGSPSLSFSFNGFAYSTDAGRSFTDGGILLADPIPAGVDFRDLFGDPLVRCSDSSTFYYGSLAQDTIGTSAMSGISVSKSTDGGVTWGGAVMASAKDAALHFLDKPWMDVTGNNLHVTYTDFEFAPNPTCGTVFHTAIEFVRSTDGGATWSLPIILDEVCSDQAFLQGSQVAVGNGSDVYTAWEDYPMGFLPPRHIELRRSTDGGATFGPVATVSDVTPPAGGFLFQGGFRGFLDLQGLAVDTSGGSNDGRVYVSWQDGRNLTQPDFFADIGAYNFSDVLLSKSSDGGTTWSAPVRVNNDPLTRAVDQYMPSLGVDKKGVVGVFFYDRRDDRRNFLIDAAFATSHNGGNSFKNFALTKRSFAPVHANDLVVNPVYMGDYDAVATDRTEEHSGFLVSWASNARGDANVRRARIKGKGKGHHHDDDDDDDDDDHHGHK